MKNILYILFLISMSLQLNAQMQKGNVLINNATVLTMTQEEPLENTDILILDGVIKKIGKGIKAAADVTKIDAEGMYVMPGIIDAHSHAALDVVNEATSPNTAMVNVGDAVDPYDITIYQALAGGVTTTHAMHGSANAVGGQCETLKLRWGTENPEDLVMEGAPRTIKFALGENPMRVHGERRGIMPRTRMGIEQSFRRDFSHAQEYMAEQEAYKNGKSPKPPMYDERMEVMADILRGEIIIHCHSYRADEIVMLMNVLEDFGVSKIVFQHVNEGFKVAPELAAFGAGASVFSDWWAYKFEVYYSTAYNAAILTRNGVVTSINSDSDELIRHLYHEAAKTQHYGDLTDLEALSLITVNPAKQLGIEDRVGSLEIGKDGDIAIFNAHPLSIYAIPQYTIVDGVVRFDINEDPDDMRVYIDPEEEVSSYKETSADEEYDSCLEGVQTEHHGHHH